MEQLREAMKNEFVPVEPTSLVGLSQEKIPGGDTRIPAAGEAVVS